ncbi:MAG: hypothetical protein LBL90_00595 [Prevotellaceae bacterium]|nr:hypothetical protein [Prevotellaceae bacterium]
MGSKTICARNADGSLLAATPYGTKAVIFPRRKRYYYRLFAAYASCISLKLIGSTSKKYYLYCYTPGI